MGKAIVQTIVQNGADLGSKEAAVPIPEDECAFEGALTKPVRDQIVSDLSGILDLLDGLGLWLAGAHLSSAIDAIQKVSVVDHASA